TPCSSKRQELITQMLISFIIKFIQPLYILQNPSFRELIFTCEPGYKIPCDKTVKAIIYDSYVWSKEQLRTLLSNNVVAIHLTTDLWTAKSRHRYLGITATWLTSNFEFCKALLSCNHLPYPHSGEDISAKLFRVIMNWNLSDILLTIVTDNGVNMVKGIRLLNEQFLSQVRRQPCVAHTLQLSVLQGLKQCKQVHRRVKCLQAFFRLPKQAQKLREAQKNSECSLKDNYHNPLDVLTDVKTRWNS
ncbi:9247_t:CDS:1, partial [Cetraspora pellucida]